MAVTPYLRDLTASGKYLGLFIADTAAELPTVGIAGGSIGFAVDTLSHYLFDGTAWTVRAMRSSYALAVNCALSATLTDAQTLFFGSQAALAPGTTAALARIYVPKSGTLKAAYIFGNALTAGSAESWTLYLRLNNTTDTAIAAQAVSSIARLWSSTALAIAVVAGDYLEVKSIAPTWATNPANMTFGGYLLIEET